MQNTWKKSVDCENWSRCLLTKLQIQPLDIFVYELQARYDRFKELAKLDTRDKESITADSKASIHELDHLHLKISGDFKKYRPKQ